MITNVEGIIPFEYSSANQLKVYKIWSASLCIGWMAVGTKSYTLGGISFSPVPKPKLLSNRITKTELVEKKYFSCFKIN